MKHILYIVVFFMLITTSAHAQKEASWWYFGYYAGLNFTQTQNIGGLTDIPTFTKGPIYTHEGCFSISDKKGNFLMASDGSTVYGKDLLPMPNGTGLLGNSSATQSGIVIPRPGNKNQFYVVSVGETTNRTGIHYSIVDMTLNNGNGDVISKNIPINLGGLYPRTDAYENIAAVGHENGRDFWLISKSRGHFFSWAVTSTGIGPNPTSTKAVGADPGTTIHTQGVIKVAPDGKYISHIHYARAILSNAQFNPATGVFPVVGQRNFGSQYNSMYSVEFSPSGAYIYLTPIYTAGAWRIPRATWTTAPLQSLGANITNLQIGPDNKLYGVQDYSGASGNQNRTLFVIPDPDGAGTVVPLNNFFPGGMINGTPDAGLPTFPVGFFTMDDLVVDLPVVCVGALGTYSVNMEQGSGLNRRELVTWDFGDGSPLIYDTDWTEETHKQKHIYYKAGKHVLTLSFYKDAAGTQLINTYEFDVDVKSCHIPVNPNVRATMVK